MQYELAKNFITSDEQGGALEAVVYGSGSVLALIGCLHVAISVYLCYAFLRPLWRADRLGGGDPALRAQTRRVLIATVVAVAGRVALNSSSASMAQGVRNSSSAQVASTLACYLNPAIYFAQPLVLFAIDSIINDLCLAILVLKDEEGDAKAARDASGLRVGVAPDDSPGLELSDGAVLS